MRIMPFPGVQESGLIKRGVREKLNCGSYMRLSGKGNIKYW